MAVDFPLQEPSSHGGCVCIVDVFPHRIEVERSARVSGTVSCMETMFLVVCSEV